MRTFDGTKCKVGDVVESIGELPDRGYIVEIDPKLARPIVVRWSDGCVGAYMYDGRSMSNGQVWIGFPPIDPLDEIDPSPGNVAKLTRRQVGEGYRIPAHDEKPDRRAEIWSREEWRTNNAPACGGDYYPGFTYRVPIAPRMVPLDPSDIKLGRTVVRDSSGTKLVTVFSNDYVIIPLVGSVSYSALARDYEISFDHGANWQRAEKDAKPS